MCSIQTKHEASSLVCNKHNVLIRNRHQWEVWCVAYYKGLTVDVERNKLYYAETTGTIGELSTDGTDHRVLLNRTGYPQNIVGDYIDRWPYFVSYVGLQWGG